MNQPAQQRFDGYITAVYQDGNPISAAVRAKAETITYDAEGVTQDGGSILMSGVAPYNRPYQKASIITARVGDYCDIVLDYASGDSRMYIHTEREDLRDCNGSPIEDLPT